MPASTINLRLDLHTAAVVRDCLRAHLRHYGEFSLPAEQLRGLALFLEEEIEARIVNASGPGGIASWAAVGRKRQEERKNGE